MEVQAYPTTKTTIETQPFSGENDAVLDSVDPTLANKSPSLLLNLSVGFAGGNYLELNEYIQGSYIALRYMPLKNEELPDWDYAVEVNKENLLGLGVGKRWYCCETYEDFLPYLRLSGNIFLSGSGELAGFAEIRRWRARASGGIGNNFTLEMGFGLAITGTDLFAQVGYNFKF
ncbi:MAG: hypothetical protein ACXVCR_15855 [Bdellovibrio sp.]